MGKILILGNKWHGNWSVTLARELTELGYECEHINVWYKQNFYFKRFGFIFKKIFFKKVSLVVSKKIRDESIERVVVITPYSIPIKLFELIKEKSIPLIGWWGDDPLKKGGTVNCMKYFDKIYLVDESWIPKVKIYNSNIFYLPHAFSQKNFFPINKTLRVYSIIFVGDSFNGTAEGKKRARILEALYKKNIPIALFGDRGWRYLYKEFPFLEKIYHWPITSPKELNDLYNHTKIVLNIHHSQLLSGTNQRTLEVAGSRAFQLSDYKTSIKKMFGGTICLYSSQEELIKLALYYIANEKEREILAYKSHETATNNHTYPKRIEVLLQN